MGVAPLALARYHAWPGKCFQRAHFLFRPFNSRAIHSPIQKITPMSDSLSLWCARWELNPQNYEPESYTYANSVTRANRKYYITAYIKAQIIFIAFQDKNSLYILAFPALS